MSKVHVSRAKNENLKIGFNLFLKNKIRAIFNQEYMCCVFTFVQHTNPLERKAYL